MRHQILSGIMGITVADALGVPVEFMDRRTLEKDPVKSMQAYGHIISQQEHGQMTRV